MSSKNKIGLIFLIIILLLFSIGGYFLMDYVVKEEKNQKKVEEKEEIVDLRIDKSKDYIYLENTEHVIESEEIHFEDVVVNFKKLEYLNDEFKNEMNEIKKSIIYEKDIVLDENNNYTKNKEGIYSLKYREYEDYYFNEYVSLVIKDYEFNIVNHTKPINIKSYIINKNTGQIIKQEDLLNKENITIDKIKEKVKERLDKTQTLNENEEIINIEETLNNFNIYAIYVNKNGKLEVSFIVKSNKIDYNDFVVLN